MPPVSERQRRAMWAAAEGHSKLGIPQEVGKEFVQDETGRGLSAPEGGELDDREAAEAIRDNELPSPVKYGDYWLFDLRITGTGAAYRDSLGEYAIRDPDTWLSPKFIDRCNGLPVIFEHPDSPGLNSDEYQERSIGNIVLPYRKGDEVWGVAKIFDADSATLMQTTHRSTSPGVLPPKGSTPVLLESGAKVLDEPLPLNLDHLAICKAGVWDKDGPPEGVRLDAQFTRKGTVMTDEERKALEKERDDARARADAAEKERDDAKARADAAEKEREDAKKRHDAEESEKKAMEAAEKEKEDKKRADARSKRHDAGKHDGEYMDCSRCDSEEEEEKKAEERERAERDKKSKKDAAPVENVEATEAMIKDSKIVKDMQTTIAELQSKLAATQTAPTMADANAISTAFYRADTLYQMLGESTPRSYPGETPISYRRRLVDGLRKFTEKWKEYAIHDSLDARSFELIENDIYADALESAKNPRHDSASAGVLREVVDTTSMPGKTIRRFYGDSRLAWLPFMPPVQHAIRKIDNRAGATN